MKTAVVIPVRMGSSRFPGKPLAKICGMPMVEHIYRRVSMAEGLEGIYVATCDDEIKVAVEAFGGKVIMTADTHQRASERTAEAAESIGADVIVMGRHAWGRMCGLRGPRKKTKKRTGDARSAMGRS